MRSRSLPLLCLFLASASTSIRAQWASQESHTKVNLYAVHSLGKGVAWASGSKGTVLHTEDGSHWQACVVPAGAAPADMRSVQGLNGTTAVAMSSGKGERSRLYRTTDGCQTWKLVFTNPEEGSSFDSLRRVTSKQMYLLAEPVAGKFAMYLSQDGGSTWFIADDPGLDAEKGESAAASTMLAQGPFLYFGSSGAASPYVHFTYAKCDPATPDSCSLAWGRAALPFEPASAAALGISAVAARMETLLSGKSRTLVVALGGKAADAATGASALSVDDGQHWSVSGAGLSGYRKGVAYDALARVLIAVGPNGTDVSTDDGKTWHAANSGSAEEKSFDAGWNALSLPFAVGSEGKIGLYTADAAKP